MQITMIPGLCSNEYRNTGGTFCESCFASFVLHGCTPDRPCITEAIDDGKAEITLLLKSGDQQKRIVITDANRESIAYGSWSGWVDFVQQLPSALAYTAGEKAD